MAETINSVLSDKLRDANEEICALRSRLDAVVEERYDYAGTLKFCEGEWSAERSHMMATIATLRSERDAAIKERDEARAFKAFIPPPHWPCERPSETRHPMTAEAWDYRNDPVGGRKDASYRRLSFAGDMADPRLDDGELAIVHRLDLSIMCSEYVHKRAVMESYSKVLADRDSAHSSLEEALNLMQRVAKYLPQRDQYGPGEGPEDPDPPFEMENPRKTVFDYLALRRAAGQGGEHG